MSTHETFHITREEALELRALRAEAAQRKAEAELAQERHHAAARALEQRTRELAAQYADGGTVEKFDLDACTGTRARTPEGDGDR